MPLDPLLTKAVVVLQADPWLGCTFLSRVAADHGQIRTNKNINMDNAERTRTHSSHMTS